MREKTALVLIDFQNDFCPGGALEVPEGDTIAPVLNRLAGRFQNVVVTQDWHPEGHHSFASAHEGKQPFETIEMPYGTQVLWPDHCIQGSKGADFHPELHTRYGQLIIRKGFRKEIDSYSAFFENDHQTPTGLEGYLRERGIDQLYMAGLATDFCVKWSVVDACKRGFETKVVTDGIKGIDIDGSIDAAMREMREAGAGFVNADEVLEQVAH